MAIAHTPTTARGAMEAAFPEYERAVARFYEMQEYHLGWRDEELRPANADSGKLIRAQLVGLGSSAVGGDAAAVAPLAAAIQLLHDFTLIHDDIEDHSDKRRGRPTVWALWGEAQAINAGDGMFVLAQLALLGLRRTGLAAETVLEVAERFNRTILRICEGQYLDISFESRQDVTKAEYLAMIERKTAMLLAAALELGAIAGGGTPAQAEALRVFGLELGLAFQIEDDILGIWGEEAVTGKPDAHDLWSRKQSLPVLIAREQATGDAAATLDTLYGQEAPLQAADVAAIKAIIDSTAARNETAAAARSHHDAALAALDSLPDGHPEPVAALRGIAQSLLGRQK